MSEIKIEYQYLQDKQESLLCGFKFHKDSSMINFHFLIIEIIIFILHFILIQMDKVFLHNLFFICQLFFQLQFVSLHKANL